MRDQPGHPVGRITGVARPDYFVFTFDPQNPILLYDYVVVRMVEVPPGSEEPAEVDVVAQVYGVERASLGLTPDHPWPVVRNFMLPTNDLDTPRAYAKVLGYKWRGRIYRPRSAPPVGSWVYRAPDSLLSEFYAVDESRRLHIGYLISRPSVPAYLDLEGVKRHLAIIAATGAGKTWTSVVLIEELLRKNATILVLDPHGEYVAMKRSACAKAPEFCGRIKVVKGHKDQEGDKLYSVDVRELDGDELAALAGVPPNASRIRNIIINLKSLATSVAKLAGAPSLASISSMLEMLSRASRIASSLKGRISPDLRFQYFEKQFLSELASMAAGRVKGLDAKKLEEDLRNDSSVVQAVNELYNTIARSIEPVLAARRYLAALNNIGIYKTSTLPLDELLEPGKVTIVNLAGLPQVVQDHIASNILRRVFEARVSYVRGLRDAERYPYPVLVVVEEAHRFIPSGNQPHASHSKTLPVAAMIASEGRKFGVFLAVITQRPSRINQDVLSQAQSQIILRIVNPRDQQAVREASEQLSQELFENLPGLNSGEAIIVGPVAPIPMMVRVRERVLDYAGTDISLVDAWGRAASLVSEERRVEARLAEKLSDILAFQVEPDRDSIMDGLSHLIGARVTPQVYRKALKLLLRGRVRVAYYRHSDLKVVGEVEGYDVEVTLSGGVRRCDCGADSTVDPSAVCEHMVAVVMKALLEGLVQSFVEPRGGDGIIDDELY